VLSALAGLAILALGLDLLYSLFDRLLAGTRPSTVDLYPYYHNRYQRTSVVFPGFSNPPGPFGQGMLRIVDHLGPMLVLRPGDRLRFDEVYEVIMLKLERFGTDQNILLYGHSMGGQLARLFQERYEAEGSVCGPLREVFLDCSPSTWRTLGKSPMGSRILSVIVKLYWGGPIGALLVAGLNLLSRLAMPAPLEPGVDRALYKRYTRGIMWYPNRRLFNQLRFMRRHQLPLKPSNTTAKVFYIGAANPSRDALVNQPPAIADWGRHYPGLQVRRSQNIGHAWPLEQPATYQRIIDDALVAA